MYLNWYQITRLGEAGLMLPLALLLFAGLLYFQAHLLSRQWALRFSVGIVITLGTKIAFFGWGIGISYLDFTGISGHTILATSILPVLLGWLFVKQGNNTKNVGISLGLLLAAIIGWSRVKVGAHSYSEVIAGWVLGCLIIQPFYKVGTEHSLAQSSRLVPATLTFIVTALWYQPPRPMHIPSHQWEQQLAKWISGHDHIHTRQYLHKLEFQSETG